MKKNSFEEFAPRPRPWPGADHYQPAECWQKSAAPAEARAMLGPAVSANNCGLDPKKIER